MVCGPIYESSFHDCPVLWRRHKGVGKEELVCVTLHKLLFWILSYTYLCFIVFKEKSFVEIPVVKMQAVKEVMKSLFEVREELRGSRKSVLPKNRTWKISDSFFLVRGKRIWSHHTIVMLYFIYVYLSYSFWFSYFLIKLILKYSLKRQIILQ